MRNLRTASCTEFTKFGVVYVVLSLLAHGCASPPCLKYDDAEDIAEAALEAEYDWDALIDNYEYYIDLGEE